MLRLISDLKRRVLDGQELTRAEALQLMALDAQDQEILSALEQAADEIRGYFNGDRVDLCSILNVKSGLCSENCVYCAQSAHYHTTADEYDWLPYDEILAHAQAMETAGVGRFSLVSSGRGLSSKLLPVVTQTYEKLSRDTNISLCASHVLLTYEQALALKAAGVYRYHHNLESGRGFFEHICTTHTYDDRISTIKNAQKAGLDVCSGGIIGLGESQADRVDMALDLRALGIKSMPVNVLNPIPDTPLADQELLSAGEILKTLAVFRFTLPRAVIRFAGGRRALDAEEQAQGFHAGANGAIVGDLLTTVGNNIEQDKAMLINMNFEI